MIRKFKIAGALVASVAALLTYLGCNPSLMTAPPGSSITLIANPPFIPAHGGVSTISAHLMEATGVPVADGTVVQFFTDLGRIDEQVKTNDGVAQAKLVSDSRSGTATIVAYSGGGIAPRPAGTPVAGGGGGGGGALTRGDIKVTIGNIVAKQLVVNAIPQRLGSSRSSHIIATVLDANGNPVPNVPVFFHVGTEVSPGPSTPTPVPSTPTPTVAPTATPTAPTPTPAPGSTPTPTPTGAPTATPAPDTPLPPPSPNERMDSSGNPVFTDNNGRAEDILRTTSSFDVPSYRVTVFVRVIGEGGNPIQQSVTLTIN